MILLAAKAMAVTVVFVLSVYSLRHFFFAFHRLFRPQRMNYTDLAGFHLPSVTVLIPMHNEEAVAHDVLEALLEADYPRGPGHLEIIPINDHSTDGTGEILDEYAARYSWIKPLQRREGRRGKAAALQAASHRP